MPDVFISYNRDDREVAHAVARALEAEGFSVWYDAALRAGEYYEEVTERNLRSAGAVVVLWSKRSTNSKWVRAEATVGERSSTLVPVLIEECDRPVRFELLQTADLTRWQGDRQDANWRGLVGDVRAAVSRRGVGVGSAPSPEAAYAAPSADNAANFETTFWNSIKDSAERADYEAYLSRYPRGHFADLARNRMSAIERTARPTPLRPQGGAAAPVAAAPAKPAPQAKAAAQPPAQPQAKASPPTRPAPAAATKAKSGSGFGMIAGAGAALAIAAVAGFLLLRNNDASPDEIKTAAAEIAETSEPAPAIVEAPASEPGEPPSEPATDALGAFPLPAEPAQTTMPSPVSEPPAAVENEPTTDELLADEPEPIVSPAPVREPPPRPAAATPVNVARTARDCESCPLMAALPGGTFVMGSPEGEPGRNAYEGPQHDVTVKPFRMGVYEVTMGEWGQCVADGACAAKPAADAKLPALRVSWNEAKAYTRWLSKKTGKDYRLPSESEWEYAARAGAPTPWNWGDRFDAARLARNEAKPVGSFDPNGFGLHDMLSNAREWVEDCYNNNFTKTPRDGSAANTGDCSQRVVRGGGFASGPADTRVANRIRNNPGVQIRYMGLRVAAEE